MSEPNFGETSYREWVRLVKLAIDRDFEGSQAAFCRKVNERSEKVYHRLHGVASGKSPEDPWLSTSTLSRWLRAVQCEVDLIKLSLIAKTGLIKDDSGNPVPYDKQVRMIYLPKKLDNAMEQYQAVNWVESNFGGTNIDR